MSYDAYLASPEGLGFNLLDGLCCREEPSVAHQVVVRNVVEILRRYTRASDYGRALPAVNVDLDARNVPAPDACLVSRERTARLRGRALHGVAPDICVEVLSPATAARDRGYKAELYANHGCAEYWLVDGARRVVEVFGLSPKGSFAPAGVFGSGDAFSSVVAPGLRVQVDEVFADD